MAERAPDHNVYILGAGFSKDAGVPLVRNFLDRSREFFDNPDSGLDDDEREQFKCAFAFKREVAKAREKFRIDLDDIEQLFGLVEMSQRLESASSATRDATVYLIAKTIQLALEGDARRSQVRFSINPGYTSGATFTKYLAQKTFGTDEYETDVYTHFALLLSGRYDDPKRLPSRTNTVITFNYDLVLDDALLRVDAKPAYQLQDAYQDDVFRGEIDVPLLKLHGSTNWLICKSCNKIHVLNQKATLHPELFRSMLCKKCKAPGLRLLLVPPSWDKSEYGKIMQPVWSKAVRALQTATRICVIGYSMPETDAFFKFLLTLGMAENDGLYKLVIVDFLPTTLGPVQGRTIETRWKEILEGVFVDRRFEFFGNGFAQFVQGSLQYHLRRAEQIR